MTGPGSGRLAFAPGRVNLIGDHTDYNGGLALPMAIGLGVEVTYRAGTGSGLTIRTDLDPMTAEIPASGPLPSWAHLANALVEMVAPTTGGHAEVRSDLPVGAGLSSSAAFAVALLLALGVEPMPVEVARLCQRAESAIGVPVGLMDPLIAMSALPGHALLIDFTTLDTEPVPLPDDIEVVVVESGTTRSLDGSAYATRRSECEAAAGVLGSPLGTASIADLNRIRDPLLRRRATHVVTEVARVRAFVEAVSDADLRTAGELMTESHRSLRDQFDVSTQILDRLVETLRSIPGVHGARMTGAGFGGCVIALCSPGTRIEVANRSWRVRPAGGAWVRSL